MSFILGAIGGSKNKTDRGFQFEGWKDLQSIFDWASPFGEKTAQAGVQDLSKAGDFYSSLLSGDRSKIAGVLSPEISTIQGQTNQRALTQSQFGNRSGGTNASIQAGTSDFMTKVQNLISSLLPASAQGLTQVGSALGSLGMQAVNTAAGAASTISGQAGGDRSLAYKEQQDKGQAELKLLLAAFGL